MKPKILEEKPVNLVNVKASLEKIHKRDGELSYRANKTLEYLQQVVKITSKQAKELNEALENLKVPRLREQHIQKLIGILPSTPKDVKVALQGYIITISQENLKKIAETIAKIA